MFSNTNVLLYPKGEKDDISWGSVEIFAKLNMTKATLSFKPSLIDDCAKMVSAQDL